ISKWHTQKNTYGWARAEVLGALVNSVFLIALCFSILVEGLKRLVEVEKIENPTLLLIVGAAGLGVNLIGLALFCQHGGHGHSHGGGGHGHSHDGKKATPNHSNHSHDVMVKESQALVEIRRATNGTATHHDHHSESESDDTVVELDQDSSKMPSSSQMNMRAVFLHVLGDALGSVIVIISALVIKFVDQDWVYYIDPSMSLMLVAIILSTTIPLLKQSAMILLQTVPAHIRVKEIKEEIEQMEGIEAVHEFHIWQLTGNRVIASAHIQCHNLHEYMKIAEKIKKLFHNKGIHSTTIQPEFSENWDTADCALACGPEKNCYPDTCCPPLKKAAPPQTSISSSSQPTPAATLSDEQVVAASSHSTE
ncbi:hypothetical protein DPMN_010006, partial [Dreissena polymorpha]